MANGCIYIGLLSKALCNLPLIHFPTLMAANYHRRCWSKHQDLGISVLPKDT